MTRSAATSFVVPYFPLETRFFHLKQSTSPTVDDRIVDELARHRGPVLSLRALGEPSRLSRFHLRNRADCQTVRTGIVKLVLCSVEPVS